MMYCIAICDWNFIACFSGRHNNLSQKCQAQWIQNFVDQFYYYSISWLWFSHFISFGQSMLNGTQKPFWILSRLYLWFAHKLKVSEWMSIHKHTRTHRVLKIARNKFHSLAGTINAAAFNLHQHFAASI